MIFTTIRRPDGNILEAFQSKDSPVVKFLIEPPVVEIKTESWGMWMPESLIGTIVCEKMDEDETK